MGLVLAFQGLYVVDALYNEVSKPLMWPSQRLTQTDLFLVACNLYYDGYHNRRIWIHACGR